MLKVSIDCSSVPVTAIIVAVACITALSSFALKTHELLLYVNCLIKNVINMFLKSH